MIAPSYDLACTDGTYNDRSMRLALLFLMVGAHASLSDGFTGKRGQVYNLDKDDIQDENGILITKCVVKSVQENLLKNHRYKQYEFFKFNNNEAYGSGIIIWNATFKSFSTPEILIENNGPIRFTGNTFEGANDVETIKITSSRVEDFPATTFLSLGELKILDLRSNRLSAIHRGLFMDLGSLHTLILCDNRISRFPMAVLQPLKSLNILNISSNKLTDFRSPGFSSSGEMDYVDLSNNELEHVYGCAFANLKRVRYISLANNSLEDVLPTVFKDTAIIHVNLDGNRLNTLPLSTFSNQPILERLSISSNSIFAMPANAFHGMPNLTVLEMNNNSLSDIPNDLFDGLSNLQNLSLEDNIFEAICPRWFKNIRNNEDLRISLENNPALKISACYFVDSVTFTHKGDYGLNPSQCKEIYRKECPEEFIRIKQEKDNNAITVLAIVFPTLLLIGILAYVSVFYAKRRHDYQERLIATLEELKADQQADLEASKLEAEMRRAKVIGYRKQNIPLRRSPTKLDIECIDDEVGPNKVEKVVVKDTQPIEIKISASNKISGELAARQSQISDKSVREKKSVREEKSVREKKSAREEKSAREKKSVREEKSAREKKSVREKKPNTTGV